MLRLLSIANFATIERLELDLGRGFTVLAGETGAGKSIILDALGLLLGGRADSGVVRTGAQLARVEGIFLIGKELRQRLAAALGDEDLGISDGELILAREVNPDGRNACRVAGRIVPLRLLSLIGERLVDIHGQGQHLSLLRAGEHIHILDGYAGAASLRGQLAEELQQLGGVRRSLAELRTGERERARQLDLLRYQAGEIDEAQLQPGEDAELARELGVLSNVERLLGLAEQAYAALNGDHAQGASATDLLSKAAADVGLLESMDPALGEARETAELLASQAVELARSLRHYRDSLEYSPERLREIEERLNVIAALKRKYGGSVEEVLAYGQQATVELERLAHGEEETEELAAREAAHLEQAGALAGRLSMERQEAAGRLAAEVEQELAELAMEGARLEVRVEQRESDAGLPVGPSDATLRGPDSGAGPVRHLGFDSTGVDRVEFLVAPNRGEPLRPLAKIASGGEVSRLMLALKSILSAADEVPTLVFDEIDAGIGGRVATVVGRKLWGLTRGHQVVCVTHVPQIACLADHHISVAKSVSGARTVTSAAAVTGGDRVQAVHEMLGAAGEASRQNAREMLDQASEWKGLQSM